MRDYFEFDFEVDGDMYYCEGYAEFYKDSSYGADADGNRGVCITLLDSIEFDLILDNTGYEIYKTGNIEASLLDHLTKLVERKVLNESH